ncbi:MAG: lamin tail domain-containing protein, partial [Myxococcales bacterium]|nr:lamin tail domain-containing protein [Myxococcales bacterium]
ILTIFDEGGNQVARNDDGGANGFCSQIGQNLTAGTYTVIVTGFSDGDVPPYLLRVEFPGGECGDGLVNPGETCDDGNTDNGDGCDDACQAEPQCGDGFVNQESEQCDDGNTASGDGCDAICSIENFDVINSRFANDGRFAEGSRDAYFFAIEEVSTVVALTSNGIGLGCPPGVDTVLTLFRIAEDGTRTQVARNDDDRGTFCSLINRSGLAPGRYVLESRDLGNNDAVDFYRLDLAIFADVNLGGVFRGGVALGGDDAFAFALPQGGPITLQTTGPQGGCSGDTVVTVYPVDPITGLRGASVAGNDDGGDNGVCSLVEAELPAGNYEAVVTEFNDDSAIEAYRLRVILPGGVQPNDVDYCRAQFPVHARAMPGAEIDLFGVFYEEGITDASPQSDANPVVRAQIGWGDFESDPMDGGWQWIPAAPNPGWDGSQTGDPNDANNDEYFGTAVAPDEPGHYSWAFRVSVDNGLTWTLCDRGPAGSADGFEPALAGRLFVGDAPSPQGNELVITEIMQNSSNVADEFGEYVEIHNTSPGPLSLDGIALTDNQRTINLPDGIVLGFQEYFVIGRSNTLDPEFPDFNGGYICDLRVPELELGNSSDLVELTLGETQLDRVAYDNGATFPDPNGSSMQLDGSLNPEQADNALGINWCASSVQFGA